jgi:hypothetical protein
MLRVLILFLLATAAAHAGGFAKGDPVRLTKVENLLLNGKNLGRVTKDSEFVVAGTVLGKGQVLVGILQEDGTWVTPSLPEEALEPCAPAAWLDLLHGLESFRDQRFDERLLLRAAKGAVQPDPKGPKDPAPTLAAALLPRIKGALNAAALARNGTAAAMQALGTTVGNLRDIAVQLDTAGHPALAVALDEGAERLAKAANLASVPAGMLDRAAAATRAIAAERAATLARQKIATRKLMAAQRHLDEGLRAAPAHPLLKAWQPKVKEDIDEAQNLCNTAQKMRRFDQGLVHALSALDDGLKLCADHPSLLELRQEMGAEIETRTSPRVTPKFLAASKAKTAREVLEQGRDLYTNRCTECHDLEMIDSRGLSGWEKMVGSMSRRASLDSAEQAKILAYLAAAVTAMDAGGEK